MKNINLKIHIIFIISLILLFGVMSTLQQSTEPTHVQTELLIDKKFVTLIAFTITFGILFSLYLLLLKNINRTNQLLKSRQLFLRTIMHELKMPIAKGRLIAEQIESEPLREKSIKNYIQLNTLIEQFANIEKVVSQHIKIDKESFFIDEVIDEAKELLMIDNIDEKVEIEMNHEFRIQADFTLMALAIKNLLDNGLRYSDDKKVSILVQKNMLIISNKGVKLSSPIENFFDPFHNDISDKNHGMGLGLYIVKTVLDMHGFEFEYLFEDGVNRFVLTFYDNPI